MAIEIRMEDEPRSEFRLLWQRRWWPLVSYGWWPREGRIIIKVWRLGPLALYYWPAAKEADRGA